VGRFESSEQRELVALDAAQHLVGDELGAGVDLGACSDGYVRTSPGVTFDAASARRKNLRAASASRRVEISTSMTRPSWSIARYAAGGVGQQRVNPAPIGRR